MNKIISYRGLLAHTGEDKILLSTKKGEKGYRITKFELFPKNFNVDDEYNMQIWKEPGQQTSQVDFSDNRLLAAGYVETVAGAQEGVRSVIVFDQEIVNQDIYVAMGAQSGNACNYYIELEVIRLSEIEATVATLKDIRNNQ